MHPIRYNAKGRPGDPDVAARVIGAWREFSDLLDSERARLDGAVCVGGATGGEGYFLATSE